MKNPTYTNAFDGCTIRQTRYTIAATTQETTDNSFLPYLAESLDANGAQITIIASVPVRDDMDCAVALP